MSHQLAADQDNPLPTSYRNQWMTPYAFSQQVDFGWVPLVISRLLLQELRAVYARQTFSQQLRSSAKRYLKCWDQAAPEF